MSSLNSGKVINPVYHLSLVDSVVASVVDSWSQLPETARWNPFDDNILMKTFRENSNGPLNTIGFLLSMNQSSFSQLRHQWQCWK